MKKEPAIDLALQTIHLKKQALIFTSSKKGCEATARKIGSSLKEKPNLILAEKILHTLSRPTKQCEKLKECVEKGIAFHHAGLNYKQREIIEKEFKDGKISIICCTPTLAFGLDLPAFRTIVKDLKRYGGKFGSYYIPVLEYLQMAGRAGRPGKETRGEAICLANTIDEKEFIKNKYIYGEPEEIYSKLAAKPVLRTYILSLISNNFINSIESLHNFISKTFYAHQFKDLKKIKTLIDETIDQLQSWNFIKTNNNKNQQNNSTDFIQASKLIKDKKTNNTTTDPQTSNKLIPSPLGIRTSELYIDPYSANILIQALENQNNNSSKSITSFNILNLACQCLEIRPLFKVTNKDYETFQNILFDKQDNFLTQIPTVYDDEYDEFIDSIKTTKVYTDWLDETDEHDILEKYNVRPGEFNMKLERIDWVMYCIEEYCGMLKLQSTITKIKNLRFRLKYGVKKELIPLLQLKTIGRVRARKLFKNNIKDISAIKKTPFETLSELIGQKTALNIKEQVGENIKNIKIKENKRKGQISLNDFY